MVNQRGMDVVECENKVMNEKKRVGRARVRW